MITHMKGLWHWIRKCKAFECALKIYRFSTKKHSFLRNFDSKVPGVKYFTKFLADFNKQGLKWKLITSAFYFNIKHNKSKKMEIFSKNVCLMCRELL